jgi:predicted DCC family thiol-disulfide oxidoreductase YuxK
MLTAWTGGQYSVLRVLLALASALVVASDAPVLLGLVAIVLAVPLALGFRDRIASVVLAFLVGMVSLWGSAVLLLHAALPPAPYGSWEARGRSDPGGDWQMPEWVAPLAWTLVVVLHLVAAIGRLFGGAALVGVVELGLLVALAIRPAERRWIWLALTLMAVASNDPVGVLFLHAFAFDPAWIPPSTRITPAVLFYDGACGLCHRVVRFILAEDYTGAIQLAPLQGGAFARLVPAEERETLPDSIVVRARDGELLGRSRAAIEVGTALGGLWRVGATIAMLLPTELADRAYDVVASNRRRMFAPPDAACPLVPPRLRARFLPDDPDEPGQAAPSAAR